jgi:hypothetical protein
VYLYLLFTVFAKENEKAKKKTTAEREREERGEAVYR